MLERLTQRIGALPGRAIYALLGLFCGPLWSLAFYVSEARVRHVVRATVEYAARQVGGAPAEIPRLAELVETALHLMVSGGSIDPQREPSAIAAEYVQKAMWLRRKTPGSWAPVDKDAG